MDESPRQATVASSKKKENRGNEVGLGLDVRGDEANIKMMVGGGTTGDA